MSSERVARIHRISEANTVTVNKIRSFCVEMAHSSISLLSKPLQAQNAINDTITGIVRYPNFIEIRGVTLDMLEPEDTAGIVAALKIGGLDNFMFWYVKNIGGQESPPVVEKIIDKNVDHFVEAWFKNHNDSFPDLDWQEMEKAHKQTISEPGEKTYRIYTALFNGMQTSTIEQFIEDTIPSEFPFYGIENVFPN